MRLRAAAGWFLGAAPCLIAACAEDPPSGPRLVFESDAHDFGDRYLGETAETTVLLSNPGDETLNIDRVVTSCGCAVVEGPGRALEPGESALLRLRVTADQGVGLLDKAVTVHCNDPRSPRIMRFTVNVRPLYEQVPALVEWGDVVHGGTRVARVQVRRVDGTALRLTEPASQRLAAVAVADRGDGSFEITLSLSAELPVGKYFENVTVPVEGAPVPVEIPVRVQVVPPFRLEPEDSLALGRFDSAAGTTATVRVFARDPSLAPHARVEAAGQIGEPHQGWLEVAVQDTGSAGEFTLQVRIRPGAPAGVFLGKLDVRFHGATEFLRTLTLSGTVVAAGS